MATEHRPTLDALTETRSPQHGPETGANSPAPGFHGEPGHMLTAVLPAKWTLQAQAP